MIIKKKKIIVLLLVTLLIISVLSLGCTPQRRPDTTPAPNNNMGPNENMPTDPNQRAPRDPMTGPQGDANQRTQVVADKITRQVPEVRNVSIVFADRIVYAAVSLEEDVSEDRARDIERMVSEAIMAEENTVDRVYVSMDPETFRRLEGVAKGIEDGRPLTGFLDEIEELFTRIAPTTRR